MCSVAEIIRALPKRMTLRQVAKELGVTAQAISYTERKAIWKIRHRLLELCNQEQWND